MATTFLMNPVTGSVATLQEWQEDFSHSSSEEWGGSSFEDAGLVEVVKNDPDDPHYNPNYGEWRPAAE